MKKSKGARRIDADGCTGELEVRYTTSTLGLTGRPDKPPLAGALPLYSLALAYTTTRQWPSTMTVQVESALEKLQPLINPMEI